MGLPDKINLEDPTSVREYFGKVYDYRLGGLLYPADFDELWPIFYQRKDHAVRALRLIFTVSKHYQIVRVPPGNSKGRPRLSYMLSLETLEFFVATRVPQIFEIYRQVFQKTVDQAQQQTELLKRIGSLESRLDQLLQLQQAAPALPPPAPVIPPLTTRVKVRALVDDYARAKGVDHQATWRFLYRELHYRYAINASGFQLAPGESKLTAIERHGHIDKLLSLAKNLLTV